MLSQKSDVFDVLSQNGANAILHGFEWTDIRANDNRLVSKLSFYVSGTEFYFIFSFSRDGRPYAIYFPGEGKDKVTTPYTDWPRVLEHVKRWVTRLCREVPVSDPWADLRRLRSNKK